MSDMTRKDGEMQAGILNKIGKPELKPCPFCGFDKPSTLEGMGEHWVLCPNCKAATIMKSSILGAAQAWNTRADLAKPSEWISVDEALPIDGQAVSAVVEHWHTHNRKEIILIKVDEDDCSWRVEDFGDYKDELAGDFNVTHWKPLLPLPSKPE